MSDICPATLPKPLILNDSNTITKSIDGEIDGRTRLSKRVVRSVSSVILLSAFRKLFSFHKPFRKLLHLPEPMKEFLKASLQTLGLGMMILWFIGLSLLPVIGLWFLLMWIVK